MKCLIHVTYYDFHEFNQNQYILFDDVILEVGEMSRYQNQGEEVIDCMNHLVLPGFVCGHAHIYSSFARGLSVPFNPHDFQELLEQLWWKIDRNLTNEITHQSGIQMGADWIKNGVTSVIDHHASGEILGSLNSLSEAITETCFLRGGFCFETSDRFQVQDCIKENSDFLSKSITPFRFGMFGMHASFTLSDETLIQIKKVVQNNPIHIHVAESILDQERCLKEHNMRVIERLDHFGLIQEDSLIVHGIYLSDNELEIIKKRNAVICLNVTSNMNNGVGLPNYLRMKEKGIRVIIGNDNISPSMAYEYLQVYFTSHHSYQSPTAFTLDDLNHLIQETYAYFSNRIKTKLGRIQTGYVADLQIVPYLTPTPLNEKNIMGHLCFGLFPKFEPRYVFVNGKCLLNDYNLLPQIEQKLANSIPLSSKLWELIQKEGI